MYVQDIYTYFNDLKSVEHLYMIEKGQDQSNQGLTHQYSRMNDLV